LALPPKSNQNPQDKNAARTAAQQDIFLREVDEALRHDQVEGFMANYGKPVLAVIVVSLAAFGGWLYWDHRQNTNREAQSETFVQALDSVQAGNLDDAKAKLEPLAAEGDTPTAGLMLAGIALEQNRKADALKLYKQVADDAGAPQPLRDLAIVRAVAADFDAMKPQDVIDRLKPMAAPGNPWFGVAGEMVGMAYLKQGKKDQAGPLFAAIAKDEDVNEGLRSRARQLAAVLGVDAVEDVVDDKGQPIDAPVATEQKTAKAGA
jgi:Uncharacterized protein conserved in bacteria